MKIFGKYKLVWLRNCITVVLAGVLLFTTVGCYAQSTSDAGIKQHIFGTPLTGNVIVYDGSNVKSNPILPGANGAGINTVQFNPDNVATSNVYQNIITLSLYEETSTFIPQGFSAAVTFDIQYIDKNNNTQTLSNNKLTVGYNMPGVAAKDYLSFANSLNVTVAVTRIDPTYASAGAPSFDITPFIQLDNEIRITSYYKLPSNAQPLTISVDPNFVHSVTAVDDALPVTWTQQPGYNYVQLEWIWLEDELSGDYPLDGNGVVTSAGWEQLFKNNSTRLDLPLTTTYYSIPLLYEGQGKLYYRIRATNLDAGGSISFGQWTDAQNYTFTGHGTNLNWQATTTFAEDGKRKSVVQYYDGSLRSRQTVTKDNTTNTTVVAETFYDYQGRPAVQILPAPTINTVIAYTQNLNLFNGQNLNADPAASFDLVPATSPDMGNTPALATSYPGSSTTGGSSLYYSSANSEIATGLNKLLPDAQGYPYTVTRYTPDATGRIMAQSGVGSIMQMGGGHQTNYYYGTPAQEELDALFGTEVGDNTHYFKNMVQDANGQMSVSYVDMHGRTIATALAGNTHKSLSALDNGINADYPNQGTQQITRNLLGTNNVGNVVKNNTIESINTLLVSQDDDPITNPPISNPPKIHTFTYTLTPQSVQETGCTSTLCYDCLYNLEIAITDESGKLTPMVWDYTNVSLQTPTNGACTNPAMAYVLNTVTPSLDGNQSVSGNTITITASLLAGSYSIRKTLTLSQSSLQAFQQQYLQNALCQSKQDIINSVYATISAGPGGCVAPGSTGVTTCASCMAQIGQKTDFINNYYQSEGTDAGHASGAQQAAALALYNAAIQFCQNQYCVAYNPTNPVSHRLIAIQEAMEADMMPYTGQYALPPNSSTLSPATGITKEKPDGTGTTFTAYGNMYYKYNIFAGSPAAITLPPGGTAIGLHTQPFYQNPLNPNTAISTFGSGDYGTKNFYYDGNGTQDATINAVSDPSYTTLNSAKPDDFYSLFKPSWQNSLLPYHPEFKKLQYALNNLVPVYAWLDQAFQPVSTYSAALSNANTNSTNNFVNNPVALDPYFAINDAQVTQDAANMNTYISQHWTGVGNGSQSLWQLAYNTVACKTITDPTALATCQGDITHQTPAAIFNVSGLTLNTDQQDQIWTSFKALYMAVRESFVNKYIDLKEPLPSTGSTNDADGLVGEGYVLHFPKNNGQIAAETGINWLTDPDDPSAPTTTRNNEPNPGNNTYGQAPGSCAEYVPDWQKALLQCPAIVTAGGSSDPTGNSIIIGIITRMKALCEATINANNPFGASTTAPGTTMPNGDNSFEQIINGILADNHVSESEICNPYLIQYPKPYGLGPVYTQPTFTATVDNCVCGRYNQILAKAAAAGITITDYTSFNNYVQQTYGQTITQELYNGLGQCATILTPISNCVSNVDANSQINYSDPYVISYDQVNALPGLTSPIDYQSVEYYNGVFYFPNFNAWSLLDGVSPYICGILIQQTVFGTPQPASVLPQDNNDDYRFYVNNHMWDVVPITDMVKRNTINYPEEDYALACPVIGTPPFVCTTSYITPSLATPQPLPAFLTCGYADGAVPQCLTCADISGYTNTYRQLFGGDASVVAPVAGTNLTAAQVGYNQNWQNYLNFKTGFSYTWMEYMQAAANATGGACNLQNAANNGNANQTQTVICPNTSTAGNPNVFITPTPCDIDMNMAINLGTQIYLTKVQTLLSQFQNDYASRCVSSAQANETFKVSYPNSEYHYTLYYYDMAGNLVKTVPPKGVHPIFGDGDLSMPNFESNVKTARAAGYTGTEVVPPHVLTTNYRYNSLNQVIAQNTPDAGISNFWYDALGRLVVSQNAKQAAGHASLHSTSTTPQYSYTLYDPLGRITEVGQLTQATPITQAISQDKTTDPTDPAYSSSLFVWLTNGKAASGEQITETVYDLPFAPITGLVFSQQYLRNRVSYVQLFNTNADFVANAFATATYYTYDIHGNVQSLVQDYGSSANPSTQNVMNNTGGSASGHRFKKLDYDYDLISGKVNMVSYQAPSPDANGNYHTNADAFYHKYYYDAENRITGVATSADNVYWENDASYSYYKHGPLSQTVLGQQQVQGLTYAYTLQGWLKGINPVPASPIAVQCQGGTGMDILIVTNGPNANTTYTARTLISFEQGYSNNGYLIDAYLDGTLNPCAPAGTGTGTPPGTLPDGTSIIPASEYTLGLNYYDGDYTNINSASTPLLNATLGGLGAAYRPLYNGNINSMGVNINKVDVGTTHAGGLLYNYGYDQLNRLVSMDAYASAAPGNGSLTAIPDYAERASYDPNGNILTYTRNGNTANGVNATAIDQLTYNYDYYDNSPNPNPFANARHTYTNANSVPANSTLTNRLNNIGDPLGTHTGMGDIDGQVANNYTYDEIGNLTVNAKENIGSITWTVYGKINSIKKADNSSIQYTYDAAGNRISKTVVPPAGGAGVTTWYVRDASGNVMSIYSAGGGTNAVNGGELSQTEIPMYGSSRLGETKPNIDVQIVTANTVTLPDGTTLLVHSSFTRGQKAYELSNHLGNVLVTVSDKKIAYDKGTYDANGNLLNSNLDGIIDGYTADVVSANDYYPFGMLEPGRQFTIAGSAAYRYGFNGQERDDDISGNGNNYTAEYWEYDPRIGRRWNVDPVVKVSESPYAAFGDNPIFNVDPNGKDTSKYTVKRGDNLTKIAKNFGVTVSELVKLNKIKNPDEIDIGQVLNVRDNDDFRYGNPELDFKQNKLTAYNNSKNGTYSYSINATVGQLASDFGGNYGSIPSFQNIVIVGGTLFNEVQKLPSVKNLINQGLAKLGADGKYTPGEYFTSGYKIGSLTGKVGQRIGLQAFKDIFSGKRISDNKFFSAENWLGSYGFSMRVTDGKQIVICVYDSKTSESAADHNKTLQNVVPDLAPTYQRYLWNIDIK